MTPEEKARQLIDARLAQSGWVVQDLKKVNPMASLGAAAYIIWQNVFNSLQLTLAARKK